MESEYQWQRQQQQLVQCESVRPDCVQVQKRCSAISGDICADYTQGAENPTVLEAVKHRCSDGAILRDRPLVDVADFSSLYESMEKCRKGVLWKSSVAHYYLHGIEETLKLEEQLRNGTYKEAPPVCFKVTHPKPRDIVSISFRDRVYQRSLNDNAIYPQMTRSFIWNNFACQKSKGPDNAREELKEALRRHFRKYGLEGGILQFDIHGYYDHMTREVVADRFSRHLDPEIYRRAAAVLENQYKMVKGYNPGSQMVQIAGISVLDPLDHYIKERSRVKHYGRYMDDGLLIHHDQAFLEDCRTQLEDLLSKDGFEFNQKKTTIHTLSEGVVYLGFHFRLTPTGKVVMSISSDNVSNEKRRLRRQVNLCFKGRLDRDKVDSCFESWKAHASKGDSYRLIRRMDKYYESLWRNAI